MVAQLRNVLTAEDSTPVAQEDDHCRPVRPERAQLDLIAGRVRQRDGSQVRADCGGHVREIVTQWLVAGDWWLEETSQNRFKRMNGALRPVRSPTLARAGKDGAPV